MGELEEIEEYIDMFTDLLKNAKPHGALENEQPLFNELKRRKELGEVFSLQDITPQMMRQLWWEELNFDQYLAPLFDVTAYKFKTFRLNLGIKMHYMDAIDKLMITNPELIKRLKESA